ncbi:DUF6107 family protein [Rhizobium sp. CC-YZS058]|uniref:DUF6107 family protein n=1 Tax=Rhizobium sp. CC-YZS058 TaxID=3042153 RepID=UPI002B05DADD|nr:DUF6107 family protein [Rhizobium sp. CC-YZS058]MEA3535550.1 DUF6107 family protein [Rhizobium sp. CC-YZS058]
MAEFGHEPGFWAMRGLGAVAGAAVSLVYMLPKGRQEAASRFVTGLLCGLVFGGPTGLLAAEHLGLMGRISRSELLLGGSAVASLAAWWVLGAAVRMAARYGQKRR